MKVFVAGASGAIGQPLICGADSQGAHGGGDDAL